MIVRELFEARPDGVNLYRTYSDIHMKIRQVDTGFIYDEAIDIENTPHTYEETDEPIENEFMDPQDALDEIFGGESDEDGGETDGDEIHEE